MVQTTPDIGLSGAVCTPGVTSSQMVRSSAENDPHILSAFFVLQWEYGQVRITDRRRTLHPATPGAGSSIRSILEVGKPRPRDRADASLALLRADLLERLGVDSHHTPNYVTAALRKQRQQVGDRPTGTTDEPTRPHAF